MRRRIDLRGRFDLRDRRVMALSAAGVVLLGLVYFFAFRDRPASPAECKEMLDYYLDMTIELDPELAKLPPEQQAAAREMKRAIRTGDKGFSQVATQCQREVRRHEHDCAMRAKTPNDWEACID